MRIHITNGDSAGELIQRVVGPEPVLPWRDVLHEGPVPEGLDLASLSAVRAAFIASCGWGRFAEVLMRFRERDGVLERLAGFDGVTLWFEHDLFDQLQLIQLLDLFAAMPGATERVGLVQADRYICAMSVGELAAVRANERPVTELQSELAGRAWRAFRSATPEKLAQMLRSDLSALPFLESALTRLLEELPRPRTGLARTEQLILETLLTGPSSVRRLYGLVQSREPAVFMGDLPFFRWLLRLGTAAFPLVQGLPPNGLVDLSSLDGETEGAVAITARGRAVLAGEADWLELHPIDRWLGGSCLTPHHVWRWDAVGRVLVRPGEPADEGIIDRGAANEETATAVGD